VGEDRVLDQGLITDAALLAAAPASALVAMAASALIRHGADMASGQLVTGDGTLVLVAHPGFGQPFGDFFATVDGRESACAVAFSEYKTVAVAEIADDPIFNGTDGQTLLLDAGARAVTSFPLFDIGHTPIGVISAHYRTAGDHDVSLGRTIAQRTQQRLAHNRHPGCDLPPILENSQLRDALANRDVIARAKGILMVTRMVGEPEAFQLLAQESHHTNTKVRDVAARVVAQVEQHIAAQRNGRRNLRLTPDAQSSWQSQAS
jgi:hypothetical protein